MYIYRHSATAQHSVNITFICTEKPKFCVTVFIAILTLLPWSGIQLGKSLGYA